MPGHTIHNQVFQIAVNAEDQANHVHDTVKNTFYGRVIPALDAVFSRLSPDDKVYRFNRLEIDLGFLPMDRLDSEMPELLAVRIEELLTEKIQLSSFRPPDDQSMEVIPVSTSLFEAFLFYLENGFLPWWLSVTDDETPEEVFRGLPEALEPALVAKLKKILLSRKARTRMVQQFPEHFVDDLFQIASMNFASDGESEKEEKPALLPVLLSGLIDTLSKLGISNEIRETFRVNLIRELAGKGMAFARLPLDFDPSKTDQPLEDFIATSVEILIRTLADKGFDNQSIRELLNRIRALLTEKSATGHWFCLMDFNTKQIKITLAKYRKERIIKEEMGLQDEDMPDEETKSGIYIRNAGLVLLWPFLKNYFTSLELLAGDRFKSREEQQKAVLLLQHAVNGKEKFAEHHLSLNKILCGLPVDEPVDTEIKILQKEKRETEALIRSTIEQWKAIGKVSVEGFRESFLKREGRLNKVEYGWSLKVERKAHDLLLDKIPWMISMVRLKWMKKIVFVDW